MNEYTVVMDWFDSDRSAFVYHMTAENPQAAYLAAQERGDDEHLDQCYPVIAFVGHLDPAE